MTRKDWINIFKLILTSLPFLITFILGITYIQLANHLNIAFGVISTSIMTLLTLGVLAFIFHRKGWL